MACVGGNTRDAIRYTRARPFSAVLRRKLRGPTLCARYVRVICIYASTYVNIRVPVVCGRLKDANTFRRCASLNQNYTLSHKRSFPRVHLYDLVAFSLFEEVGASKTRCA